MLAVRAVAGIVPAWVHGVEEVPDRVTRGLLAVRRSAMHNSSTVTQFAVPYLLDLIQAREIARLVVVGVVLATDLDFVGAH